MLVYETQLGDVRFGTYLSVIIDCTIEILFQKNQQFDRFKMQYVIILTVELPIKLVNVNMNPL